MAGLDERKVSLAVLAALLAVSAVMSAFEHSRSVEPPLLLTTANVLIEGEALVSYVDLNGTLVRERLVKVGEPVIMPLGEYSTIRNVLAWRGDGHAIVVLVLGRGGERRSLNVTALEPCEVYAILEGEGGLKLVPLFKASPPGDILEIRGVAPCGSPGEVVEVIALPERANATADFKPDRLIAEVELGARRKFRIRLEPALLPPVRRGFAQIACRYVLLRLKEDRSCHCWIDLKERASGVVRVALSRP